MKQTDEELMTQYKGGSSEAFSEIYKRHSSKIFGYLIKCSESSQEASDVFQEVFIKLHRSKHLYRNSFPVLPWIFTITHSVLVDQKRAKKRRNEVFNLKSELELNEALNQETSVMVQNTTPNFLDVKGLLNKLPENQSAALHLRFVEEKTFIEIAKSLETTPVNVRKITSRAVKALRKLVQKKSALNESALNESPIGGEL